MKALLQSDRGVAAVPIDLVNPMVRGTGYGKRRCEDGQIVVVPMPEGDVAIVPWEARDVIAARWDEIRDRIWEWDGMAMGISVEWTEEGAVRLTISTGVDLRYLSGARAPGKRVYGPIGGKIMGATYASDDGKAIATIGDEDLLGVHSCLLAAIGGEWAERLWSECFAGDDFIWDRFESLMGDAFVHSAKLFAQDRENGRVALGAVGFIMKPTGLGANECGAVAEALQRALSMTDEERRYEARPEDLRTLRSLQRVFGHARDRGIGVSGVWE